MSGVGYKRVVIGIAHNFASLRAIEVVADFAELLGIELLAAFMADTTLPALTELFGARELRALEQVWQTIEATNIAKDTDLAAALARRRFSQGVGGRSITASFDVVAGVQAVISLIGADDIVAVIEPSHPVDRITWQFKALLDAAFGKAGAALMVPREPVRTSGPIVTMANEPGDVAVRAAVEIAAILKDRLIIVTEFGVQPSGDILNRAMQLGVEVERIVDNAVSMSAVQPDNFGERMRIISRSMLTKGGVRLPSSLHGVPLLVIGGHQGMSTSARKESGIVMPSA